MRSYLLISCFLSFALIAIGQTPDFINYQAVIRDKNGTSIKDADVKVDISITTKGGDFNKSYSVKTNDFGVINLQIGGPELKEIDWSKGGANVNVIATSPQGIVDLGSASIATVPYALFAENSGSSIPGPAPAHIWEGTKLKFENPDGTFGPAVELKGTDGTSVTIKGSVDTPGDLPIPYNGLPGDLFIVISDGGAYVWNGTTWNNLGKIQGPAGPQGDKGDKGNDGLNGVQGEKGDKGDKGIQGPTGDQGSQGEPGEQGVPGATGSQGPQGNPGTDGAQGPAGTGVSIIGTLDNPGDLPSMYNGNIGDMYIVLSNGHGYVWNGTTWSDSGQIQGPPGPQGSQGAQGAQGIQGIQGVAGLMGPQGTQGAIGPQGNPGATGSQGPMGNQGAVGPVGPAGPQGAIGNTGPTGNTGATGAAGPIGPAGPQGVAGNTGPTGNPGPTGATGPAGPAGVAGATGAQGPQGIPGAIGPIGPQGIQGVPGPAGTYAAGSGILISNGTISNTGDTNGADDVNDSDNFGGDVSGTYNNLSIVKLKGKNIDGLPTNGQVMVYNGTEWKHVTPTIYTAGTGISIVSGTVTNTGDTNAADDVNNSDTFGGDVGGTYDNISVNKIKGVTVGAITPTEGQTLTYTGGHWKPVTPASSNIIYGAVNASGAVIFGSGFTVEQSGESMLITVTGTTLTTSNNVITVTARTTPKTYSVTYNAGKASINPASGNAWPCAFMIAL